MEKKLSRKKMLEKLATIEGNVWLDTNYSPHGHGCESVVATSEGLVELPGEPISVGKRVVDKDRFFEILAEMQAKKQTAWVDTYGSGIIEEEEFMILKNCKVAQSPLPDCVGKKFFFVGSPANDIDLALFESAEAARGAAKEIEDGWVESELEFVTNWDEMSDEEMESAFGKIFPP